ncbi:MAG TPA: CPBP family intramembrane glutamic endopeptidase [Rubrobacteraceae bacterium]|nr:CPBP family intramembrane glutamic endopeptidase [Rubrobacteraceae bacterium]
MPTATESQQQTSSSSLKGLVARHPVAAFLVMAFTFGWTIQFVGVYFDFGLSLRIASSIGVIFGLALPAFLVTAAVSGKAGVRDLLGRCLRWRVGIHWYLLALLGLLVVTLLGASAFSSLTPLETLVEKWPLFFTMFLPEILIAVLLIQLFEETAWTGFMQDTLQERHGPLLASLMVAPAFALFHLMSNLLEAPQITLAFVLLGVQVILGIFLRVVIMWLYNSAGRSVLIVALFHSAFNSVTGSGGMRFTGELISGPEAMWIPLAVLAVVAVLVVLFTRGRLSYERERAAPGPAEAMGVAAQPRVQ